MRRRQFIKLFGGVAATLPFAADGQPTGTPVVGFLRDTAEMGSQYLVAALKKGLREAGVVEGQNFTLEFGWGDGHRDRLPALAAAFAHKPVKVIVASATSATIAAKAATSIVPIVFAFPGDPVELGLVASINRPGGNATGVSYLSTELAGKRLGIPHELVPTASVVGILVNPNGANARSTVQDIESAAPAIGLHAANDSEVDSAFENLAQRVGAILIGNDSYFTARSEQIAALAARFRLPAMYSQREIAEGGGLISYGADLPEAYRLAGNYAARILKGENPADLPVLQPTKYELVINIKTAKQLGLTIPSGLLALADEVIE